VIFLLTIFILMFSNSNSAEAEHTAIIKNEITQSSTRKVSTETDSGKQAFVTYLDGTYASMLVYSVADYGVINSSGLVPFIKMASIKINDLFLLSRIAYLNFGSILNEKKRTIYFNHSEPNWFKNSEASLYYNGFDDVPELHLSLKVKAKASRLFYMGQFSISKQSNNSNEISSIGLGLCLKYNEYFDFFLTLRRFEFLIREVDRNGVLSDDSMSNLTANAGFSLSYPIIGESLNLSIHAQIYPIEKFRTYKNTYELLFGFSYRF
jgi:hypothetical protein